jgi:hypothetical protein
MIKLIKEVRASENGWKIDVYQVGEHESLPPIALQHAKNIGAIEESKTPPKNKATGLRKNK